jgi:transcriptional regulator with XRE-family HTH domain
MRGDQQMDILANIKELLANSKLTEYQFAQKCNIGQSTLSGWLKHNRSPRISSLVNICNAFDMTLIQLIAGKTDLLDLTDEQRELFKHWNVASRERRNGIMLILKD